VAVASPWAGMASKETTKTEFKSPWAGYATKEITPTETTYDIQIDAFNKHLQEFYHEDRGEQTYLDFLNEKYPDDARQLTTDFISAVNQTQPEFLGTQADYLKAHPIDKTALEKVLGVGTKTLQIALAGLEYGFYPFTAVGMAQWAGMKAEPEIAGKVTPKAEMPEFKMVEGKLVGVPEAEGFNIKDWLPGGEKYKEYRSLPLSQQLLYEAPAWALASLFLPSATSLRAGLAPTTRAGGAAGAAATVARGALAPIAGIERAVAYIPSKIIQKIMSMRWTSAQKAIWAKVDTKIQNFVLKNLDDVLRAHPNLRARATPEALCRIAANADDILKQAFRWQQVVPTYGLTGLPPSPLISTYHERIIPNFIRWSLEFAAPAKTDAAVSVLKSVGYSTEAIGKMSVETAWENIVTKLGIAGAIKALLDVYEPEIATTLEPVTTVAGGEWQAVTGEVPGIEFRPITTNVGKGYAILQNGNPVGRVSYGTTEALGVEGMIIGRIDITEAARRQGLASQAIEKILSESEASGVSLYTGMLEPDGVKLFNALEERGVIKLTPAKQRLLGNVVTRGVPEYAPTTAMAEWETVAGKEIKPAIPKAEVAKPVSEKKLRQSIMAAVKGKGLAESKYRALFKKVGGTRNLTEMGTEKLTRVLEAVREARPVKISGKNVITAKTEKAIQTLKDALIREKRLTPEIYENLKKSLDLPTDKYENNKLFITERQARSLIRQMNIEAEVGLTKWDVMVSEGLAKKPELKTAIDNLTSRIVKENKPKAKVPLSFKKTAIEISSYPNDVKLSGTMSILRALRRFQEQLGGREVTRIYDVAEMKVEQRRLNDVTLANIVNAIRLRVPQLATIVQNKGKMAKIQQWLDADLKFVDIKKPDLTPEELEVVQLFRERYDLWKNIVRLERFKDAYFHYGGRAKEVVADLIKNGTEGTSDVAIPDAPLKDIKEAIEIYETQGETALRKYLNTKDWGVKKSGYSFSQILHPQLRMYKRVAVRATTTSLHQRKGLEFLRDEKSAYERLIAYERQMINLNLQPYYRKMDMEFRKIVESEKISPESARDAAYKISLFMREVKGYPIESPIISFLLRMGGWSFGTLAKVPWMSVRNLHQNLAFHSDKSEILKSFFGRGFFSNPLTKRGRLDYTDALAHQYKGVQQEQILMGYIGKTPIENLIRRTDYYHLSDKANRYMSMNGSGAKAERALNQYLKDKDIAKFLKNSGANELSATEQIRILEYLALETYDYNGVLNAVSGSEAAIRDIANRITTLNHFNYVRYLRSVMEMGETGRIIGSLVAFPRSVAEKYIDIFSRIKRLGGADRKRAIHALIAMIVGSAIASAMLRQITGKERDAYNPLLIFQWQVGGLAIGATQNIMELYRFITNLTFAQDEGEKKYYFDELILLIPQLGDSFIPFYAVTMNLLESLTDSRYLDREYLRKLREVFDENYQMNEEYYRVERDLLEKIQHGLFGANTPDPSNLEQALKKLEGTEENLGKPDEEGEIYTTSNLGSDIDSAVRSLDPSELITENGFSDLVLARIDYQVMRDAYFEIDADKRYDYREENPEVDANLFFWSYVTTLQSDTAKRIVLAMIDDFNVPPSAIRGYENVFGAKATEGQSPWWGAAEGETESPWWGGGTKSPWAGMAKGAGMGFIGFPKTKVGGTEPMVSGKYTPIEEMPPAPENLPEIPPQGEWRTQGGAVTSKARLIGIANGTAIISVPTEEGQAVQYNYPSDKLPEGISIGDPLQVTIKDRNIVDVKVSGEYEKKIALTKDIRDFLAKSSINEKQYLPVIHDCKQFTSDLLWEASKAELSIGAAIITFNDRIVSHRMAWIERNGEIFYIEPQADEILTLEELNKHYEPLGGVQSVHRVDPDGNIEVEMMSGITEQMSITDIIKRITREGLASIGNVVVNALEMYIIKASKGKMSLSDYLATILRQLI
jgi:hypothetical protein